MAERGIEAPRIRGLAVARWLGPRLPTPVLVAARSSPGAPHRGGGLPSSKPGLCAGTHDLRERSHPALRRVHRRAARGSHREITCGIADGERRAQESASRGGMPVVPGQLAAPPTRVRALSDASASRRQRVGTRIRRCRADPPSPLDPCHGVGPRKRPEPPLALRGGDPKQTSERQRPRREEGLFAAARQELAPGRRICGLDDARPHDPAEVERTTFGRHDEECTRAQDRLVARGC